MENLGINPISIGAQIINFLILLVIFVKFLYKPLLSLLEKRQKEIDKGLKLTKDMEVKQEEFLKKQQEVLAKARSDGRTIVQQAVEEAKEKQKAMIEEEREAFAKDRERLMEELKIEKASVLEEAKRRSVDIAVLINEKMLKNKLSKKEQEAFVADALLELKKQSN
jgi:F-type H+-transporting ATPase subunit b